MSFPGEIANRLIELLELDHRVHYDYVFNMITGSRKAREILQGLLAPSDYRVLNLYRLWIYNVERHYYPRALASVHVACNLNKGTSLVFCCCCGE